MHNVHKRFKRLLPTSLEQELESRDGFSRRQCDFVKRPSTIDAIEEAISEAQKSKNANGFCAVIMLDIRNVFNSADCVREVYCILQMAA